jgi:hypothetical protein
MKTDFNSLISATITDFFKEIDNLFKDNEHNKYDFDFIDFPEKVISKINSENNYSENLYQFLNAYEEYFTINGLKERYVKVYYQIYYCFFLSLNKWGDKLDDIDKNWIALKWYSICYNSSTDKQLDYLFRSKQINTEKIIDPETDIKLILENDWINDLRKERYIYDSIDWFLQRFDLVTAKQILQDISPEKHWYRELTNFLFPIKFSGLQLVIPLLLFLLFISMFLSLFLSCFPPHISFLNYFPLADINASILNQAKIEDSFTATLTGLLYFVSLFMLFSFLVVSLFIKNRNRKGNNKQDIFKEHILYQWTKLLVPRLFAGIVVGYLPLLLSQDLWQLAINISPYPFIIILIISVLLCYFFLKIEVSGKLTIKDEISRRAKRLFIIGIFESLAVGVIIADLITLPMIEGALQSASGFHLTSTKVLCGVLGIMIPKVVILFFPLALLIGIFVQLIWEEKPITHPL